MIKNEKISGYILILLFPGSFWTNTAYSHTENFEIYQDAQLVGAVTLHRHDSTSEEVLSAQSTDNLEYCYYFNRNLTTPLALFDATPKLCQTQLTCFRIIAAKEPTLTRTKHFAKSTSDLSRIDAPPNWPEKSYRTLEWQQSVIIDPVLDITRGIIAPEASMYLSCYTLEPTGQSQFIVSYNARSDIGNIESPQIITLTGTGFTHNLELKIQQSTEQPSTITVDYTINGQSHAVIYKPVKIINFSALSKLKKRSEIVDVDTESSEYETTWPPKRHSPSPAKSLTTAFEALTSLGQQEVSAMDTSPARLSVTDWVAPENPDFIHDLQEHGDEIYTFLKQDITCKPAQRTCPMPGMEKLVNNVNGFIASQILTDPEVSGEDKFLYCKLVVDLQELANNKCPWDRSFTLAYKAAHFISFYNKDKAPHYVAADKR